MEIEFKNNECVKRLSKEGLAKFYQIKEKMKSNIGGNVFYPKDTQIMDTAIDLLYNKIFGANK